MARDYMWPLVREMLIFRGWDKIGVTWRHLKSHFGEWNSWISMNIALKCVPNFPVNSEPSFCLQLYLTYWGRVTHISVRQLATIGPDNGLSTGQRHVIIWTNAGTFLIGTLGINYREILVKNHIFSFKKMHFKMSSGYWLQLYLGLNVLTLRHAWMSWNWFNNNEVSGYSVSNKRHVNLAHPVI